MPYTKEQLELGWKLKSEGLTWQQIEDQTGMKVRTLRDNLKKNGYNLTLLPKQQFKNRSQLRMDSKNIKVATQMKEEGKTLEEISKTLGFPKSTLRAKKIHLINPEVDRTNRIKFDLDYFEEINTEAKAYFLGLITADGTVSNKGLRIELKNQDRYILEKFRDEISPTRKLYTFDRSQEGKGVTCSLEVQSKYWIDKLIKYNIFPNKSFKDSHMPLLNKKMQRHYIRGFLDGNGSIFMENQRLRIKFTHNELFLKDLQNFLNLDLRLEKENEVVSTFKICKVQDTEFLVDYLYKRSSIYLERKYKIVKAYKAMRKVLDS